MQFEDGRAVYTNTLRASNFVSGEITRQSTLNLFVSCRMDQESVSQIMYLAPNNNNSITGTGTYNTSMAFYTSSGFYNQVTGRVLSGLVPHVTCDFTSLCIR